MWKASSFSFFKQLYGKEDMLEVEAILNNLENLCLSTLSQDQITSLNSTFTADEVKEAVFQTAS